MQLLFTISIFLYFALLLIIIFRVFQDKIICFIIINSNCKRLKINKYFFEISKKIPEICLHTGMKISMTLLEGLLQTALSGEGKLKI